MGRQQDSPHPHHPLIFAIWYVAIARMTFIHTMTVLICLSAVFSYVNHRWLKLPLTIGLMALALAMSLALVFLGKLGFAIEHEAERFVRGIDFNEALMQGMLSFLLFAGSLHVNINDLYDHKWSIALLASIGVLLSTLIVGFVAHWLFGAIGLPLPLIVCLLFGALISPTDPIAVLAILKKVRAPKHVAIKITGESLFNDGVGVAVFLVLSAVAGKGDVTLGESVGLFIVEAIGGAALGLLVGYIAYRMLMTIDAHQVEILITLALVMGLYGVANALHTSGPIAIVVAGLFIGNRGRRLAMSETTRKYLDTFWELIDELLNAVLFVLIGLEVLVLSFQIEYLEAGLMAIPVVLLARFVSVKILLQLLGLIREYGDPATLILTWGGLRGGISVALALSLPSGRSRDALVTITYIVVAFSILIQGLTIGPLIRKRFVGERIKAS